jgi:hypothetical protein
MNKYKIDALISVEVIASSEKCAEQEFWDLVPDCEGKITGIFDLGLAKKSDYEEDEDVWDIE